MFRKLFGVDAVVRNFIAAARNPNNPVVVENEDLPGYFMEPRFKGASKETKAALLEIMPREEWEQMKESAWDDYILEGSFYRKDAV